MRGVPAREVRDRYPPMACNCASVKLVIHGSMMCRICRVPLGLARDGSPPRLVCPFCLATFPPSLPHHSPFLCMPCASARLPTYSPCPLSLTLRLPQVRSNNGQGRRGQHEHLDHQVRFTCVGALPAPRLLSRSSALQLRPEETSTGISV